MVKERIGAVIIRDKHLLLVGDLNESFFWTPGGKIESNENHEIALKRELKEELDVKIKSINPYFSTKIFNDTVKQKQTVHYYFVEIQGKPNPKSEIKKIYNYNAQNYYDKNPEISSGVYTHLIPKLLEDKLL